jgi:hypothetical protein
VWRAAADQFGKALDGELDADAIDARYYYAASLDRLGDSEGARAEYDRFATAFPKAGLAVIARRRSSVLARGPRPPAAANQPAPKKQKPKTAPAPDPGVVEPAAAERSPVDPFADPATP